MQAAGLDPATALFANNAGFALFFVPQHAFIVERRAVLGAARAVVLRGFFPCLSAASSCCNRSFCRVFSRFSVRTEDLAALNQIQAMYAERDIEAREQRKRKGACRGGGEKWVRG